MVSFKIPKASTTQQKLMNILSISLQVYHRESSAKHSALLLCLIFLLSSAHLTVSQAKASVHPYQTHVWTLRNFLTGAIIGQSKTNTPAWTVRLADIFSNDRSGKYEWYMKVETYWCPSNNPGKNYCTYPGYWFCGYWGCETIVTSNQWKPPKEDEFLKVTGWPSGCISKSTYQGKHPGNCTHLTVTVLQPQDPSWALGKMWSVYIRHDPSILNGLYHHGTVIQIIKSPSPKQYLAIGPNELVASREKEKPLTTTTMPNSVRVTPRTTNSLMPSEPPNLSTQMLLAALMSLNTSHPNLTKSCWLCYDSKPPFYEGIGLNVMFSYSKKFSPKQCKWNTPRKGITLKMVSGQGICIGSQPLAAQNKQLCSTLTPLDKQHLWAIPAPNSIWACHTAGITPCVSIKHFNEANDFCVQVIVIPRILYHTDDEVLLHFEAELPRQKRELLTTIS